MGDPGHQDEIESLRLAVQERDRLIAANATRAAQSETMLNAVYRSLSWRLTGPLRGFALRHPGLARLWAWAHLPPVAPPSVATPPWAGAPWAEPPLAVPRSPEQPAPAVVPVPLAAEGPPRTWFFLEDTIEWLQAHAQLSGVGRVTAALFFASTQGPPELAVVPCRLEAGRLVSVSVRDTAAYLAARAGLHGAAGVVAMMDGPPAPSASPRAGDTVLFTGMVWTPRDAALMRALRQQGIRFGVYVYDLIPLSDPAFVTPAHAAMFADWLAQLVGGASVLFVPSPIIRDHILQWAERAGLVVAASIVPVRLGSSLGCEVLPVASARCGETRPFVLSVGTIDARKNQALLCRIWVELVQALGPATPRLVLVGRDDLGVAGLSPAVAGLVDAGVIEVRQDVDDAALAGLYRDCLLTAFPSLAEGHGLPIGESLVHGKLCIASDLPVIRHHAGDLVWYHPPGDEAAATALFLRALQTPQAREAAEAAIPARFRPTGWAMTLRRTLDALRAPAAPQVSIILVNRNAAGATLDCIRSIRNETGGVRHEILVVDNGSDPAELARLEALGGAIRLLTLGTDRGPGEARNIAAEAAVAPVLCLLDTRMRVEAGWLPALLAALAGDPAAAAAGPAGAAPGDALLVDRNAFLAVGGFDLAFEPGGYEDEDLCRRLRAAGLGVVSCAGCAIIAGPGLPDDPAGRARRDAVLELNRDKLAQKWAVPCEPARYAPREVGSGCATAALWTPYALTPGGGERFLLTLAAALAMDHAVTIVTPHRYSRLRLMTLGRTFGVDVDRCGLATDAEFQAGPAPDLMITLGNQITPSVPARAANSLYICQFPFPVPIADADAARAAIAGYRAFIGYSRYAGGHIAAGLAGVGAPGMPIEIVYPPVPAFAGDAAHKLPMILSVGRFVAGGHSKRHDAMIVAFKRLHDRAAPGARTASLHLVGSSYPAPEHLDHLARLRQAAVGYPIEFHVNAPAQRIAALYRDAMIYWHAAGLDADLVANPGVAEHFGISLVEAMSAEAVVIAFAAGGPAEIVTQGVDGHLFHSEAELVDLTERLMQPAAQPERLALGQAARRRAGVFSTQAFIERVRGVVVR